MDFVTAVKTCFSKYADINGRATRSEYWWFTLFLIISTSIFEIINPTVSAIYSLLTLIPSICVSIRRLQDIGKSGWWLLLTLTGIGIFVIIYWACQPSQEAENQWGAKPVI